MTIFIDNVTINVDGSISNMDFLADDSTEKENAPCTECEDDYDFTERDFVHMEKAVSKVMGVPQDIVHKVIDGLCSYMDVLEEVKREKND